MKKHIFRSGDRVVWLGAKDRNFGGMTVGKEYVVTKVDDDYKKNVLLNVRDDVGTTRQFFDHRFSPVKTNHLNEDLFTL